MTLAPDQERPVIARTTVGDEEAADRIARALVEERLAACVQVAGPIRSTYRWRERVEEDEEFQLTIKTVERRLPDLAKRLMELHPYETPEFVVVPVDGGSKPYLDWLAENSLD